MQILLYGDISSISEFSYLLSSLHISVLSSWDCLTNQIISFSTSVPEFSYNSQQNGTDCGREPLHAWLRHYLLAPPADSTNVDLILSLCAPPYHLRLMEAMSLLNAAKNVPLVFSLPFRSAPSLCSVANHQSALSSAFQRPLLHVAVCLRHLPVVTSARNHFLREGTLGVLQFCDIQLTCGSLFPQKASDVGDNDKSQFDWTCDALMGGGVLQLYGAHMVDLLVFLTGHRVVSVMGSVKAFTYQTEAINGIRHISADDLCVFQAELEPNVASLKSNESSNRVAMPRPHANISLIADPTRSSKELEVQVRLFGTKGHLQIHNHELKIVSEGIEQQVRHLDPPPLLQLHPNNNATHNHKGAPRLSMPRFVSDAWTNMLMSVKAAHYEVVVLPTVKQFQDTERVLEAVRASARKKTWISV